jgi:hypothetical protein
MKCSENTPACGTTVEALAVEGDNEVDVARTHLLQHDRLLAKLRTGELVDTELAATQLLELRIEDVAGDAIRRCTRLVIGEGEFALRRGVTR